VYVPLESNCVLEINPPPPPAACHDPSPRRKVVLLGVPVALILATVTTELSMVHVAPLDDTVMSPLSPSLTPPPPPPPISTTVPFDFFVNNFPSAVLIANSPTVRLPALGVALAVLDRLCRMLFAIAFPRRCRHRS
jgi:hypothetical protein